MKPTRKGRAVQGSRAVSLRTYQQAVATAAPSSRQSTSTADSTDSSACSSPCANLAWRWEHKEEAEGGAGAGKWRALMVVFL